MTMADTDVVYDQRSVDQGLEALSSLPSAVRAKYRGDPLDCAVKNTIRNDSGYDALNKALAAMGAQDQESRKTALEFLFEQFLMQ